MRCRGLPLLVALGSLAAAAAGPAHAAAPQAATDAFRVTAPRGAWTRAADLDPPGRLTWVLMDPRVTTAQLRVEFLGVRATTPDAAFAELLGRERADILERAGRLPGVERGEF